MMALDKELRPDHRHPNSLQRGASSEGSLSPEGRYVYTLNKITHTNSGSLANIYKYLSYYRGGHRSRGGQGGQQAGYSHTWLHDH